MSVFRCCTAFTSTKLLLDPLKWFPQLNSWKCSRFVSDEQYSKADRCRQQLSETFVHALSRLKMSEYSRCIIGRMKGNGRTGRGGEW